MDDTIDRSGCPGTRHGTRAAAGHYGCTCPDALTARRRYRKHREAGLHLPAYVDATGSHRRIRALEAAGFPLVVIGEALGYKRGNRASLGPTLSRRRIRRERAELIAVVYDRLSGLPGPSPYASKRALDAGHVPPWVWRGLGIDDPATHPATGVNTQQPSPDDPWGSAACRSGKHDPELWFGEQEARAQQAIRHCMGCPLQRACLRGALLRNERSGVWGALAHQQLQEVRKTLLTRLNGRRMDNSPELEQVLDRFTRQAVMCA